MGNCCTAQARYTRPDSELYLKVLHTTREVLVRFGEYRRIVTVVNDSYQSLLAGFQKIFSDVLPCVPPSAILFQRYDHDTQNCGEDICEGDSLEELLTVCASVTETGSTNSGQGVFPLNDRKYNLWLLTSGGYLYSDGHNLTASGKADTDDATGCKWIAKDDRRFGSRVVYWRFETEDGSKEIVATNVEIGVADVGSNKDGDNLFIPDRVLGGPYLYTYTTLQRKPKPGETDNKFLGANRDGTMTLINKSKPPTNPPTRNTNRPQALFAAFLLH